MISLPPIRNRFPFRIVTVLHAEQLNTGTGRGYIPFLGPVTAANFSNFPLGVPLGVLTALYYANALSIQGAFESTFSPAYSHTFPEFNAGNTLDKTVRFVGGSGAFLAPARVSLGHVACFACCLGAQNSLPPAVTPTARAFIFGGNPFLTVPTGPVYLYQGLYYPYISIDCITPGYGGVATSGEGLAPFNANVNGHVTLKVGDWNAQIPLYGTKPVGGQQITCNLTVTAYPYTS